MSTKSIQHAADYQRITIQENLQYFKSSNIKNQKTFAEEIALSLKARPRTISPKYFYDNLGSKLFDRICKLPEYYPYNCESSILKKIAKNLIPYLTNDIRLVELGSGSSTKTRLLINALLENQEHVEYFPIDISDVLIESAKELCNDYKNLQVTGIIDTYENGLDFIEHYDDKPNLITFLGSSFGNFNEEDGNNFLKKIHDLMKSTDYFLIGLDMEKNNDVLFKAYNDTKGLTAKFNLNILERINRELDADFKISKFAHKAYYNESKGKIEMYIRSLSDQTVTITKAGISIQLSENELIHTENSHKFTMSQIDSMFEEVGLDIVKILFDTNKYFCLVLAKKF